MICIIENRSLEYHNIASQRFVPNATCDCDLDHDARDYNTLNCIFAKVGELVSRSCEIMFLDSPSNQPRNQNCVITAISQSQIFCVVSVEEPYRFIALGEVCICNTKFELEGESLEGFHHVIHGTNVKCAYKFCVYITCVRDVFCTKYHVIKIFPSLFAHGLKVRCVYIVRRRENVCVWRESGMLKNGGDSSTHTRW